MLAIVILGLFVAGWWRIYGRPIPVVGDFIQVPVLALVGAAVGILLAFRPRRGLYVFGVLTVVLALIGLWLASPVGGQWIADLLRDPNYFGLPLRSMFGIAGLLLPIGWVLLGTSVANWRLAIATYLIPGVALVVSGVTMGFFGPLGSGAGQMWPWVPLYFLLEWPVILFIVIGVFGYAFG